MAVGAFSDSKARLIAGATVSGGFLQMLANGSPAIIAYIGTSVTVTGFGSHGYCCDDNEGLTFEGPIGAGAQTVPATPHADDGTVHFLMFVTDGNAISNNILDAIVINGSHPSVGQVDCATAFPTRFGPNYLPATAGTKAAWLRLESMAGWTISGNACTVAGSNKWSRSCIFTIKTLAGGSASGGKVKIYSGNLTASSYVSCWVDNVYVGTFQNPGSNFWEVVNSLDLSVAHTIMVRQDMGAQAFNLSSIMIVGGTIDTSATWTTRDQWGCIGDSLVEGTSSGGLYGTISSDLQERANLAGVYMWIMGDPGHEIRDDTDEFNDPGANGLISQMITYCAVAPKQIYQEGGTNNWQDGNNHGTGAGNPPSNAEFTALAASQSSILDRVYAIWTTVEYKILGICPRLTMGNGDPAFPGLTNARANRGGHYEWHHAHKVSVSDWQTTNPSKAALVHFTPTLIGDGASRYPILTVRTTNYEEVDGGNPELADFVHPTHYGALNEANYWWYDVNPPTINSSLTSCTSTSASYSMTSSDAGWTIATVFSLVGESPATIFVQSAGTGTGSVTILFGSPPNYGPYTISDGTNQFTLDSAAACAPSGIPNRVPTSGLAIGSGATILGI